MPVWTWVPATLHMLSNWPLRMCDSPVTGQSSSFFVFWLVSRCRAKTVPASCLQYIGFGQQMPRSNQPTNIYYNPCQILPSRRIIERLYGVCTCRQRIITIMSPEWLLSAVIALDVVTTRDTVVCEFLSWRNNTDCIISYNEILALQMWDILLYENDSEMVELPEYLVHFMIQ